MNDMLKLGILRGESGYSLSEVMQNAALQYLNINGEYKVYEANSDELEKLFKKLKNDGVKGVNVTIPHKIKIISFLDELSENAKLAGAVNTVTFYENGKTKGDNTDIDGFWEAMPENIRKKIPGNSENVSILGCGGAAHACAIALILNNAKHLKIYGRNTNKLKDFKGFLESKNIKTKIEIDLLSNIDLSDTFLLTNTTPIGMFPNSNDSPISKESLSKISKDSFVYDIIYKPKETKLLSYAKELKLNTLNGIEMLLRQGAKSLNIWLEKDIAPISVMRLAVLNKLQ